MVESTSKLWTVKVLLPLEDGVMAVAKFDAATIAALCVKWRTLVPTPGRSSWLNGGPKGGYNRIKYRQLFMHKLIHLLKLAIVHYFHERSREEEKRVHENHSFEER